MSHYRERRRRWEEVVVVRKNKGWWWMWTVVGVAAASWVDPDSPISAARTRSLVDGGELGLVFSDEFETEGRVFDDGSDPRWTAMHKNDYTNDALHFYHQDYANTAGGYLNITTAAERTRFTSVQVKQGKVKTKKGRKEFRSGMIQSWNKFCFTGGILEVRARLPGKATVGGLWPAAWLLGNLARSTYVASSEFLWPWSYDVCDRENQRKQALSACAPRPGYGLHPREGRGAPEIDLLEVMPGQGYLSWGMRKPYVSTSLQIAPGKKGPRPVNGDRPHPGQWYEGFEYGPNTSINVFFYGLRLDHDAPGSSPGPSYQADALSANTPLQDDKFWRDFHVFRLEWEPRQHIKWFLDDNFLYGVDDSAIRNVTGGRVPDEPSYLLFNTAVSSTWGFPDSSHCDGKCFDCSTPKCKCALPAGLCESLPAHYLVDYVRVYQRHPREGDHASEKQGALSTTARHTVGCSTDLRPTAKYIEGHRHRYVDPDRPGLPPLLKLKKGGAPCRDDNDCAGKPGQCRRRPVSALFFGRDLAGRDKPSGVCVCPDAATGPTCRASVAYDDIDYEARARYRLDIELFYAPPALRRFCATIIAVTAVLVFFRSKKQPADARPASWTSWGSPFRGPSRPSHDRASYLG